MKYVQPICRVEHFTFAVIIAPIIIINFQRHSPTFTFSIIFMMRMNFKPILILCIQVLSPSCYFFTVKLIVYLLEYPIYKPYMFNMISQFVKWGSRVHDVGTLSHHKHHIQKTNQTHSNPDDLLKHQRFMEVLVAERKNNQRWIVKEIEPHNFVIPKLFSKEI